MTESGEKEFLGFLPGGRESREAWEGFLTHLVRRGVDPRAVKLIISDGCPGMIRAIKPYSLIVITSTASFTKCLT